MSSPIVTALADYYRQQGIHPEKFKCCHQQFCSQFAYENKLTETKMSLVGSKYGQTFPRIVVLSLDPPLGAEGKFSKPHQRTTEYVTTLTEAENYSLRPKELGHGAHWYMTQIIVCDIITLFGYRSHRNAAVVRESYSDRPIENVTPYFAHVNAAKCSMNWLNKGQANSRVHERCSRAYLLKELEILQPAILISQGKSANKITGNLLGEPGIEDRLPQALKVDISQSTALWLPMDHPARYTHAIRDSWPFYVRAIKRWEEAK